MVQTTTIKYSITQQSIKKKLLSLGFHIGHSLADEKKLPNNWFLGIRRGYFVFNLDYSIYFLQKAMYFLKKTNFFFSITLFYYSSLQSNNSFELTIRAFLKNTFISIPGCSFLYLK